MTDGHSSFQAQPPLNARPPAARRTNRLSPFRIACIYLGLGLLWIWFTDSSLLLSGAQTITGFWASAWKGTLYVCVSAAIVYWLVGRGFRDLVNANALLQAVTDGTTNAVFVKDRDGRYLLFNAAAAQLFGKSVADVLGRDDTDLFEPESARAVMERDRQVMECGFAETAEEELTAAGVTRTYLATKAPYRDDAGAVAGVIGISHEITDRKRDQDALREKEAFARGVLDSMASHVAVLDPAGGMVAVNELWRSFALTNSLTTSPAPRTGLGTNYLDTCDESARLGCADAAAAAVGIRRVLAGTADRFAFEYPCHSADDQRWFAMSVTRLEHTSVGAVVAHTNITERKSAELALRDRERLLGIVTGSARVGLVVVNDQYEYLFANEAYADIFGLNPAEVLGRRVPDLLAAGWSQIQPRLDRALAGEAVSYELTLPSLSGDDAPRWFRATYEPRADGAGTPTVVVVVIDVTEQKRSEANIRESEERYRRLVEVLPVGVFVHAGGKIVFCNPSFVRLTGAAGVEELLGKTPFDLAHPDDHAGIRRRTANTAQSYAVAGPTEMRLIRLDGRAVPVSSVATSLTGSGPPAILVVLSDLSERERSAVQLRSVLGSVTDAIVTIDERGTVRSANPATERQFGYTEAEMLGGNVNLLMPEPYHGEHDGYIAEYLRTGVGKVIGIGREVTGRRKDGTTFPLELTVTEFQLDGERHFTGVVRDITVRRRLEAEFQQAQKMEAVGRLAGGVAHDFNNLLTVINGYSELLLTKADSGGASRDPLLAIQEAGERAARLTKQLLAFSRKAVIEPKLLDLNELVLESAKLLRRLIGEDIQLLVMPDPLPLRIKADPGQLEQVVMNLVVNARDAMPTGGRLTIETRSVSIEQGDLNAHPNLKSGRYVRLRVTDTGQGMTEEVKHKIFEPFFTTKGVGQGTGLGLAVVHGVVEQCGGHIEVDSTIGVGTTFTILFPVAAEAAAAPKADRSLLAARGKETLLLVEDESAVRAIVRIALISQGFTVLEAARGADAIQLAADYPGPIHLLITDVVMPEIGGRQLAEAVRKKRSKLPVLYMSGYTDDALVHHGLESTAAFIQKPFTPLALARKVRAVLDGSP